MKAKIIIVADRSGSMDEAGKSDIELNAIRAIRAWCRQNDVETEIFAWGKTVEPAVSSFASCEGCADIEALEQFCRELPPHSCVLLLSDGVFQEECSAAQAAAGSYLIPVAVGADHDRESLRSLSGWEASDAGVYDAYEILDAVRDLMLRRAMEADPCS